MLHVVMKGHGDGQELAKVATGADLTKWPGVMLKLDLGEMTAGEVMAAASKPGADHLKWQVCEANYFIGEDALLHHQQAAALTHLKAARDGCPKSAIGYGEALLELKRLGVADAGAK